MPGKDVQNTDPKDQNAELASNTTNNQQEDTVLSNATPVREITQTDRINKRLLMSLLENMNKNQFYQMGTSNSSDAMNSSDNNDDDWK